MPDDIPDNTYDLAVSFVSDVLDELEEFETTVNHLEDVLAAKIKRKLDAYISRQMSSQKP